MEDKDSSDSGCLQLLMTEKEAFLSELIIEVRKNYFFFVKRSCKNCTYFTDLEDI